LFGLDAAFEPLAGGDEFTFVFENLGQIEHGWEVVRVAINGLFVLVDGHVAIFGAWVGPHGFLEPEIGVLVAFEESFFLICR